MDKLLWRVTSGNAHYITWAIDRERAKGNAVHWLGNDPDHYKVTPLTAVGDRIHIGLTLQV